MLENLHQFFQSPVKVVLISRRLNQRHFDGMMEIIRPNAIQPESIFLSGIDQSALVPFIFCNNESAAFVNDFCDLTENVPAGLVENRMRRVEAETVDMKLLHPVLNIREVVRPHLFSVGTAKVNGFTPWSVMFVLEVVR